MKKMKTFKAYEYKVFKLYEEVNQFVEDNRIKDFEIITDTMKIYGGSVLMIHIIYYDIRGGLNI